MSRTCTYCGKRAYSDYCVQHKPHKRITQKGKKALAYDEWRDAVAIPYLDDKYGHVCASCGKGGRLDVDHIQKRRMGGAPSRTMNISNVQYLCRECHNAKG